MPASTGRSFKRRNAGSMYNLQCSVLNQEDAIENRALINDRYYCSSVTAHSSLHCPLNRNARG